MAYLQATHENIYKYVAAEEYFNQGMEQTVEVTVYFKVFCESGRPS